VIFLFPCGRRSRLFALFSAGLLGFSAVARAQGSSSAAQAPLTADDAAKLALQGNPLVRAAYAQYAAALHQIDQAYAPQDPVLTWEEGQSPNGLNHPTMRTLTINEAFQFPGKAWLQGDQAHRSAEIARLAYEGAVRDAGAQAQTAYYQALLDGSLAETAAENASTLDRVLKVAQVAYAANQVSQSDLISAEFDLSQATQTYYASRVAEANDEAALNQALGRDPREALSLANALALEPLKSSMNALVDAGLQARQELLEAALGEKNAKTALTLARLEFFPDFNVGYSQNRYLVGSAAPAAGDSRDNSVSIGFNLPVFFWFKQHQDVESARNLLDAARADRRSAELQTEAGIVTLYRTTRLAYDTAALYRDSLIPLARQDFQVALIAYQSGKVDFTTLSATLQRIYNARIGYLTAANQFLAGRVALQAAIGRPLPL
jgi:outer membrane protein TolC